jgi:SET domain-containing protein
MTKASTRRIQVRRSGVHGKGVFALRPITAGERILEYKGEIISSKEADRRLPDDPEDPSHTFFFSLNERKVIDANFGGNAARYINHSCDPNCETEVQGMQVFIHAIKDIRPGEELHYDYHLQYDGRHTAAIKRQYACRCGARHCRGTMLARKSK